jgi:hypothetical protein
MLKFYYDIVMMKDEPEVGDSDGGHMAYGHNLFHVTGIVEAENEECARDAVIDENGRPEYWEEFYEYTAVKKT